VASRMTPQEALLHEYGQGWLAGAEDALKLLMGEPAHGGVPYSGHRPEELVVWANTALEKMAEARR
jgi:hypothetical protein